VGDEVVLLGEQGGDRCPRGQGVADGTITYEVATADRRARVPSRVRCGRVTPTGVLVGLFGAPPESPRRRVSRRRLRRLARSRAACWPSPSDPEWQELERTPARAETPRGPRPDGTVLHCGRSARRQTPTARPWCSHPRYALGLRAWHYQRRDLGGEFRIIAYDQRGHGASERRRTGDYSIGRWAGPGAVLDALATGRARRRRRPLPGRHEPARLRRRVRRRGPRPAGRGGAAGPTAATSWSVAW
jgi:hypothetical protein